MCLDLRKPKGGRVWYLGATGPGEGVPDKGREGLDSGPDLFLPLGLIFLISNMGTLTPVSFAGPLL